MKKAIPALLFCLITVFATDEAIHAQSTLIHYWHFNNFTTAMYTPAITGIDADFSIHDTSKAKILFAEIPGTTSSYSTYIDPNPAIVSDYDTVNARLGQPDGNQLRPRNPVDSMRLLFYIPTVHYKNIVLKYGTQSSSVAHGDTYQYFDYSVDSGLSWTTSGLSELYDSAWLVFKLVNVSFSDPLVNNNPKLVFRIRFLGNTTLTSGNNRFDNVTVEGDSIIVASTITTGVTGFGPYCNATTSLITVPFTTVGTFTGSFSVQLSNSSGSFATGTTIIGAGTSSPITAAIPAGTPAGNYRLRVINTSVVPAVFGSDNGSDIIVNGPPVAYSVTGGGTACSGGSGVPIGLANSQTGVSYQLYRAGSPIGTAVTGTGGAISFGNQILAGTYTVRATYTATTACNNTMSGSATVTLSPSPAAVTGIATVCTGQTITLHDATTGGTWGSSSTTLATVTTSTGIVAGIAPGTSVITYTAAGCTATAIVTVNALSPISGVTAVCVGATTSLSDAVSGGTWSVNNSNSSIGLSSGLLTGVTSGSTSIVTYTTPAGCLATATASINTSPSPISGPTAVCASATINLTNAITGGTWVSSNMPVATIGITGALSGVSTGTSNITYTLPGGCAASLTITVSLSPGPILGSSTVCVSDTMSCSDAVHGGLWSSGAAGATIGSLSGLVTGISTGTSTITYSLGGSSCTVTKIITINPSPAAISGSTSICSGAATILSDATSGGAWSSSNTTVATVTSGGSVTGSGTGTTTISYLLSGCAAKSTITINATPTAITGPSNVCVGSSIGLLDAVSGGSWSSASANVSVGPTGSILGVAAGSVSITYSIGSCSVTKTITVNPVATMAGPTGVCVGSTAMLIPSIPGGTWLSAPTSSATVTGSGVVSGVSPGPAAITYTLPTGCITSTAVTVNTAPTAIIGTEHVCVGSTTGLDDGARGGTWNIAPISIANVGLSSGVVAGISAGTAVVTYSLGTGCTVTSTITVNPLPSPISGSAGVCQGLTIALTDATTGGTWSISNTAIATINSAGGVGGIIAGNDTVSYTIPTGCASTVVVTVNPLPSGITVSGYVCLGLNTNFSDVSGGGTWSSSNTSLATIDSTTGIVTGIGAGAPIITYTLPTTCIATLTVTVNSVAPPITGTHHVCEGLTTSLGDPLPGGTWSSSDATVATVNGSGVVSGVAAGVITISYVTAICPATTVVTVNPIPGPISGTTEVCVRSSTLLTNAGGGSWSSRNPFVATIDAATGIATGVFAGVTTITYTLDVGCSSTVAISVDPLPSPITGASTVCLGASLSLGETTSGGTWSSPSAGVATINSSGLLTGLSDGVAIVSYTIASGCAATRAIDVISVPSITGLSDMCAWGATLLAHDSTAGGTWTSSSVSISATGLITSGGPGIATISYTIPAGCSASATISVNPLPGPITGNPRLCVGLTTALSDTTAGGSWSTGDPSIATVGATGVVNGVSAGVVIITYKIGSSGCVVSYPVTVNPLPSAIAGTPKVCIGATTTFFDAVTGGTWSSANASIATDDVATGVITGTGAGVTTVTYTLGASCISTATVTVEPLPFPYPMTGGGGYCIGGRGVDVGLIGSYPGIRYQLYNGVSTVGSPFAGTYTYLNFGLQTVPGDYYVIATDTITSCTNTMSGSAPVVINPLPTGHTVTGGGSYCSGGAGVHIGLGASDIGVNYQLYDGSLIVGSGLPGTGSTLDFGLKTVVGTYDVIATNAVTGCRANMPDSVTVTVTPLVTPTISVASSLGNPICAGANSTFTATTTNGGVSPVYQWKINSASVAATGPSYSYTPANGDIVKAVLISSAVCAAPDTVSSSITMNVQPVVVPTIAITSNPGTNIIEGQYDTLTANITNGGSSPIFQWKVNGTVLSGVTSSTYISSTLANNDVVTCTITNTGTCGQTASSQVSIHVSPSSGVSVLTAPGNTISIVPNPNRGDFNVKGTINTSIGANERITIEMTDMLGQLIYSNEAAAINGELNESIHINNTIANGMYILRLQSGGESKVFHVVIEK